MNNDAHPATTTYKRPDIIERLALYWRTYADLPSLWLHPETPGYTHGMLIADTRDARLEIERLRERERHLLEVIRHYNPDDALFDGEKVARNG